MMGSAVSKPPNLLAASVTTAADTMVIGPVGPLAWVAVPPKSAARMPKIMAPYRPAMAPSPDCTPNANASASGRATTPATTPPYKSPLRFLKS